MQSCRTLGFGVVGPIPLTAIWLYIDRYGLPEWTIDAIISLEAAWRKAEADRVPAPPERPMSPARPGRPSDGR